jgi:hypothetical protein
MTTGLLADAYEALRKYNVQDAFIAARAAIEREQESLQRVKPGSSLLSLVVLRGLDGMDFAGLKDEMFSRMPELRRTAEKEPRTVYWLLGHYVEALIEERGSCIQG